MSNDLVFSLSHISTIGWYRGVTVPCRGSKPALSSFLLFPPKLAPAATSPRLSAPTSLSCPTVAQPARSVSDERKSPETEGPWFAVHAAQINSAGKGGRSKGRQPSQSRGEDIRKVNHSKRAFQEEDSIRKPILGFRQDPGFPADVLAGNAR